MLHANKLLPRTGMGTVIDSLVRGLAEMVLDAFLTKTGRGLRVSPV